MLSSPTLAHLDKNLGKIFKSNYGTIEKAPTYNVSWVILFIASFVSMEKTMRGNIEQI